MPWIYSQSDGRTFRPDGTLACIGYSGFESGKNNPALEGVIGVGPLPRGTYTIQNPHESDRTGPLTLDLVPDPATRAHILALNRQPDSFKDHGDNLSHDASHGCVVTPHAIRVEMRNSTDKQLVCVAKWLGAGS